MGHNWFYVGGPDLIFKVNAVIKKNHGGGTSVFSENTVTYLV